MDESYEAQAREENEITRQAAERIWRELLKELYDAGTELEEADAHRAAHALERAIETGWKLGAHAAMTQVERHVGGGPYA
ncbi:MAG TPA: hypothetical protein VMI13_01055 [Solirubrobacteraceae bacterium]|nr:hypothetical protein [Solirubrobacteraceae bacterium]